ncbi:hypothetical protein [Natranaeroarchaeum aerophilus]|uniref:Uncharacterized protein n=1 Tax=Natranaeroarchaeum aerophilus TaxID=2917711 RepID=A0AAE3K7W5_9EURY|nr:hypothetical protein [Natranaeroarchaeum aerophilus]MCL9814364.1 hypothetical protein [Natranaeroarchaeum aerophilus]
MARVHGEFFQAVVNHPYYTDAGGHVREEMDSVLTDKAEFASADIQRSMNY